MALGICLYVRRGRTHHAAASPGGRPPRVSLARVLLLRGIGVSIMSNHSKSGCGITRRNLLAGAGQAALASSFLKSGHAAEAPAAPVALARCSSYGSELLPTLTKMFDQIGGLGRIAKGKTVAVK